MINISFDRFLENKNNRESCIYDISTSSCYFPKLDECISMFYISDSLAKYATYVTKNESFTEREEIRNSSEWKSFTYELKVANNWTCQKSGFDKSTIRILSKEIFGLDDNHTWCNNYLTVHHIDGESEYNCRDKNKLIVLNRAIHMTLHNYDKLVRDLPVLKGNYKLWFELGSLVPLNYKVYPWLNITKKNRSNNVILY